METARSNGVGSRRLPPGGKGRWGTCVSEQDGDSEQILLYPLADDGALGAGGGAPVDVADVVPFAILAIAEVFERLADLRHQRHAARLISPAGRQVQARQRREFRMNQDLPRLMERLPAAQQAEGESCLDAKPVRQGGMPRRPAAQQSHSRPALPLPLAPQIGQQHAWLLPPRQGRCGKLMRQD